MTDAFDGLISPLLAVEGGYVFDPHDAGGETNWGVTVAVARANGYFGPMKDMTREQAAGVYRTRYWQAPKFDQLAAVSLRIAAKLFDVGVNMGPATGVTFLQRSLNVLNRGAQDFADTAADGAIGVGTITALSAFLRLRGAAGEAVLLKAINCLQGARYVELAEGRTADEEFEFGWLANRIGLAP